MSGYTLPILTTLVATGLALSPVHGKNWLLNGGFENGLTDWTVTPSESPRARVLPEAASTGKLGLRAGGAEEGRLQLASPAFPVEPGKFYRLSLWGRVAGHRPPADFRLAFLGSDGKEIPPVNTKGFWPAVSLKSGQAFENYIAQAAAPDGAGELKIILVFRGGPGESVDLDDIWLGEVSPEEAEKKPLPPMVPVEPLLAEIQENPTRGAKPPMIVLKFDDLKDAGGKPHARWTQLGDFVEAQGVKAGIGVIAKHLEGDKPEFFQWIKDQQTSGRIEFWLHAWDHEGHEVDGVKANEFEKRPYEDQNKRVADAQTLARGKLGFSFRTFGPPGGGGRALFDEQTVRVLREDPAITAFLYPQPMDETGQALSDEGKVTVLGRVWSVNIEAFVGRPRFDTFLQGYAHNRGRPLFVLQSHPAGYGPDQMAELTRIVEFLKSQGAVFVTPQEAAAALRKPDAK